MPLITAYPKRVKLAEFWSGGATYFLRFLRLALYVLLVLMIVGSLCFILFSAGGLNPLATLTEAVLIKKFWIATVLFTLAYFFISIFKELAKAKIVSSSDKLLHKSNLAAAIATLRTSSLSLGLINLLILVAVCLIYFLLKKLIGSAFLPSLIAGQLFLVFRMAARFVKQASFVYANRTA